MSQKFNENMNLEFEFDPCICEYISLILEYNGPQNQNEFYEKNHTFYYTLSDYVRSHVDELACVNSENKIIHEKNSNDWINNCITEINLHDQIYNPEGGKVGINVEKCSFFRLSYSSLKDCKLIDTTSSLTASATTTSTHTKTTNTTDTDDEENFVLTFLKDNWMVTTISLATIIMIGIIVLIFCIWRGRKEKITRQEIVINPMNKEDENIEESKFEEPNNKSYSDYYEEEDYTSNTNNDYNIYKM